MTAILSVEGLTKSYASGFEALKGIDLSIKRGEIFALLGPNGAGKSTLINIICGIVTPTGGRVQVDGHDIARDYRAARALIGLVPQELATDAFETAWATVRFSRGLFGKARNDAYLEQVLKDLSLWDKRNEKIMALSGGMKRRVLIAKALAHEPRVLFLDEPTAGVDVELRRDLWAMARRLRESGVTIILTTHYIEEAEEMADRIGVIHHGQIILVDDTASLIKKLGQKTMTIQLTTAIEPDDPRLAGLPVTLAPDGRTLSVVVKSPETQTSVADILRTLIELGLSFEDVQTAQSSLEDIFVTLVGGAS